jgi:hypothetical protein
MVGLLVGCPAGSHNQLGSSFGFGRASPGTGGNRDNRHYMDLKDWTGRKGGALSLILAALGVALCREPICIWISTFLVAAGITVLAIDRWLKHKAGPRIVLCGQDAFHVKRVGWPFGVTDVLSIRLINAPQSHADNAIAKDLGAEFTVEGVDIRLPWIQARNDYSPQPPELSPGERPELIADLGIDKWREYNLIIKEPQYEYCYLFNNDSFRHPRGQNPAWGIGPGKYKVEVRVSGVEVRERFECIFLNPGQGGSLEVKSFEQVAKNTRPRQRLFECL